MLKREEVIFSETFFRLILKISDIDKKIQAGEYFFEKDITTRNLVLKLKKGDYYYRKLLIPEGATSFEVISILNNNQYLLGDIKKIPKEGSLFPDTYFFNRNDNINLILKLMKNKMIKEMEKVWKENNNLFASKQELLIFASLIEAETKKNEEKVLVASVFHNRLKVNMKLQSDSSVLYGKNYYLKNKTRSLSKKDLEKDTAWNTYTRKGLPITPICNPGIEAIKAAIKPAKTKYFFFVSDGKDGHRFSKSLKEHIINIKRWKNINK